MRKEQYMKAHLKLAVLTVLTLSSVALAGTDPTKYDCRAVVDYKRELRGNKVPEVIPIWACPHKDKMTAGQCETSWLFGMRCKK
jgi:hypothetical protein